MHWLVNLQMKTPTGPRQAWILAGLCVWVTVVGAGMCGLAVYSSRSGIAANPPVSTTLPAGTINHKYRLLMFAHPRCPCTAASVSELARLMSRCTNEVEATVYFFRPEHESDSWVTGTLWNSAVAIPGVRAEIDPHGQAAVQFGSTTSGQVLLYDSTGQLRFQGGITQGRGHEGDNAGKLTIMSIVRGDRTSVDHSPVYGCAFGSPSLRCGR